VGHTRWLKFQLLRRAAVLSAVLENEETKWADGQPFDFAEYLNATNVLRRLAVTIGLNRVARTVALLGEAD
jgi:hypothetical protein